MDRRLRRRRGRARGERGPARRRPREDRVSGELERARPLRDPRPVRHQAVPGALRHARRGPRRERGAAHPERLGADPRPVQGAGGRAGQSGEGRQRAVREGGHGRLHRDGEARRLGYRVPARAQERRVGIRRLLARRQAQRQGELHGVLPVPQAAREAGLRHLAGEARRDVPVGWGRGADRRQRREHRRVRLRARQARDRRWAMRTTPRTRSPSRRRASARRCC